MTARSYALITIGLVGLTAAIFAGYFWFVLNRPIGAAAQFSIRQGQGTRDIARELKNQKLISSPLTFSLYVYAKHWYLQSGVYTLEKGITLRDLARLFHEGKIKEYLVTIPEGWRVSQIDEELDKRKIIQKGEFLKVASASEGYLFPDTYRFSLNITPAEIKKELTDNFQKKTAGLNITPPIITLASVVEREAKFDEDRPKIAGVYLNRLEKGMRLEADPTIQYGKGSWLPISAADYKNFQSSYNTYLHDGLPPGPICNPGLKSIEAVLFPQKDGYLYFFHKADGHAVYSRTLEEHQANLQKYR